MSRIQIQTSACQWLITYKTKVLTTWFLNLPLDEFIDNKKHKVWSSNSKPHEAQLEDQSQEKAQEDHLEEGKATKPTKARKAVNQVKMVKKS
jgi:hypothetical protein